MSRGFVKEEDQEEIPIIPPRAPLPPGVTNYVTPVGYQQLLDEKEELEEEWRNQSGHHETDKRKERMFIDGKLNLLNERIASARIIRPEDQPSDEVRFGAAVEFENGKVRQKFQITGVDEADVKKKKIAFTAPIARALIGKKVGETAEFQLGKEVRILKVIGIKYF